MVSHSGSTKKRSLYSVKTFTVISESLNVHCSQQQSLFSLRHGERYRSNKAANIHCNQYDNSVAGRTGAITFTVFSKSAQDLCVRGLGSKDQAAPHRGGKAKDSL